MLYKSMAPEFVKQFWNVGTIRVSSMSHFANMYGDIRHDSLEGETNRQYKLKEVIKVRGEHFPLPDNIKIRGGSVTLHPGAKVHVGGLNADALIFSVSEIQAKKFGSGSYRIADPNGFGERLASSLKRLAQMPVVFSTVRKVEYGGYKESPIATQSEMDRTIREIDPGIRVEDYFLKPSCNEDEREWRFIFVLDPSVSVPNIVNVDDLALTNFCEKCGTG